MIHAAFAVALLSLLCATAFAAEDEGSTSAGEGHSLSATQFAILGGVAGTAFLAVLAVGLLLHRRRQRAYTAPNAARLSASPSGGLRPTKPNRSSSILLRHAVTNKSLASPTSGGMRRGGRRKGAPTAIMVEVPPASANVESTADDGGSLRVQQAVGLHVPPSPAYDFRGRSGEMPVTPRTPSMGFGNTTTNADADRMI